MHMYAKLIKIYPVVQELRTFLLTANGRTHIDQNDVRQTRVTVLHTSGWTILKYKSMKHSIQISTMVEEL